MVGSETHADSGAQTGGMDYQQFMPKSGGAGQPGRASGLVGPRRVVQTGEPPGGAGAASQYMDWQKWLTLVVDLQKTSGCS